LHISRLQEPVERADTEKHLHIRIRKRVADVLRTRLCMWINSPSHGVVPQCDLTRKREQRRSAGVARYMTGSHPAKQLRRLLLPVRTNGSAFQRSAQGRAVGATLSASPPQVDELNRPLGQSIAIGSQPILHVGS